VPVSLDVVSGPLLVVDARRVEKNVSLLQEFAMGAA
jgi:hypothetical protein